MPQHNARAETCDIQVSPSCKDHLLLSLGAMLPLKIQPSASREHPFISVLEEAAPAEIHLFTTVQQHLSLHYNNFFGRWGRGVCVRQREWKCIISFGIVSLHSSTLKSMKVLGLERRNVCRRVTVYWRPCWRGSSTSLSACLSPHHKKLATKVVKSWKNWKSLICSVLGTAAEWFKEEAVACSLHLTSPEMFPNSWPHKVSCNTGLSYWFTQFEFLLQPVAGRGGLENCTFNTPTWTKPLWQERSRWFHMKAGQNFQVFPSWSSWRCCGPGQTPGLC